MLASLHAVYYAMLGQLLYQLISAAGCWGRLGPFVNTPAYEQRELNHLICDDTRLLFFAVHSFLRHSSGYDMVHFRRFLEEAGVIKRCTAAAMGC